MFLPVFYDVDPSHVRNITGTYAEAFAKHEVRFRGEKEKLQKWRNALQQAASVCGWHFIPGPGSGPGYEYKLIGEIVEYVFEKINHEKIDELKDGAKEFFDDLEESVKEIIDDLEEDVKEIVDDLEEGYDDLKEDVKEFYDDLEEGVKGIFLNIVSFFDSN
ncbi:disease resistance protein RUN1-like isoform X2 [Trifolium pratense]|nr:disease resistance protein RUN1-like isoform X2 [Trifolium pratense]